MANTYDFYKPKLDSEYPEVDGPVSVVTYVSALDQSYARYKEKMAKVAKRDQANGYANGHINGIDVKPSFTLDEIDYAIFHAPYGKQVQKGYGRMFYNDFLTNSSAPQFAAIPDHESILSAPYKASLTDKNLEKTFIGASKSTYGKKVEPSMYCSKRCGNMYTASLYGCLASLISAVDPAELKDKRVSVFAFGSGYASSFFSLRVKGDTSEMKEKMDLLKRLESVKVVPCQEYVDALAVSPMHSLKSHPLFIDICCRGSSGRRTTVPQLIPPMVLSKTFGRMLFTLKASTPNTGESTRGRPRPRYHPRTCVSHNTTSSCFHILQMHLWRILIECNIPVSKVIHRHSRVSPGIEPWDGTHRLNL